jgi:hypothetical protein
LLSKVQRQLQRETDDGLLTEGRESMACSNTLSWWINNSILQAQQALLLHTLITEFHGHMQKQHLT